MRVVGKRGRKSQDYQAYCLNAQKRIKEIQEEIKIDKQNGVPAEKIIQKKNVLGALKTRLKNKKQNK